MRLNAVRLDHATHYLAKTGAVDNLAPAFLPCTPVAAAFWNRPSETTLSDDQNPKSAGFEEASRKGDELLMVARALASDRMLLVIPAWVYLACLVVAAVLTRVSEDSCRVICDKPPLFVFFGAHRRRCGSLVFHLSRNAGSTTAEKRN